MLKRSKYYQTTFEDKSGYHFQNLNRIFKNVWMRVIFTGNSNLRLFRRKTCLPSICSQIGLGLVWDGNHQKAYTLGGGRKLTGLTPPVSGWWGKDAVVGWWRCWAAGPWLALVCWCLWSEEERRRILSKKKKEEERRNGSWALRARWCRKKRIGFACTGKEEVRPV